MSAEIFAEEFVNSSLISSEDVVMLSLISSACSSKDILSATCTSCVTNFVCKFCSV